jgi:Kdo2-lipid IVA lauroyltransferase/acyltransferase
VLRTTIGLLRALPGWLAYGIADLLTPVLVVFTFASRRRATRKKRGFYRNTQIVFRDGLSPKLRRRLLWRWARHMTHVSMDLIKMPDITTQNLGQFCDVSEMARVRELFDRGQGMIGATGHVGVYEYTSHLMALSGMKPISVFKESPVPIVTDIINDLRSTGGQILIERTGAVRRMMRELRSGGIVGILADVSSKESEVFVPFLGTDAATNNSSDVLHVRTGSPILVGTTQRIGRQRFKLHVWDIIDRDAVLDREADPPGMARRINDALTRAIVTYPEQWFWDSRRFRTRPDGEVRDDQDLPPRVDDGPANAILQRLSR